MKSRIHVPVVQRRLRNVQKGVMHVQTCCFTNLNLLVFCRSCCSRREAKLKARGDDRNRGGGERHNVINLLRPLQSTFPFKSEEQTQHWPSP